MPLDYPFKKRSLSNNESFKQNNQQMAIVEQTNQNSESGNIKQEIEPNREK